ncbi:MAG: histidine phosphatase family protein [Verrucomicrobia bacterium]|nr:histidine phosphatase family protein [Verrucomicrobiota bacterium]
MSTPTKLYLLRHGEVETRYHRIFGGRIDMELSPRGHEQARTLAEWLRTVHFNAIYASPMKRAQQTLAPLQHQYPAPTHTLADLREVDFGEWTGLSWQQVHDKYKVSAFEWLELLERAAIPNAESTRQLRARVEPCLRKILAECPGQTVAVVCHGGVIRMLLAILLQLPVPKLAHFDIEYASVTAVECLAHRAEVELLNFTPWRDLP